MFCEVLHKVTWALLPMALLLEHYLELALRQTPTQPKEHELAPSHPAGEERQK